MLEIKIEHGDSREILKSVSDNSVDSCVTDPPYSLVSIQKRFGKPGQAPAQFGKDGLYQRASSGFMGQQWDTGETAHDPAFWSEVFRVLKPGAHIAAFAGTRTYHRMAVAIEDSGFDIRDQIAWCFGTGFPKSHKVGDGWGTALKPAWEPICLARKPLSEPTVAANFLKWGTGAINIDGCRIEGPMDGTWGSSNRTISGDRMFNASPEMREYKTAPHPQGRWPANFLHDGSDEVITAFPAGGSGSGEQKISEGTKSGGGTWAQNHGMHEVGASNIGIRDFGDSGSAARFFYSAKADAEDRWGSKHPTVKPVVLMRWLARLITPTGGCVLDPFAGTGTTGVACLAEGFGCILIEREPGYLEDIRERIAFYKGEGKHSLQSLGRHVDQTKAAGHDLPLFKPGKIP